MENELEGGGLETLPTPKLSITNLVSPFANQFRLRVREAARWLEYPRDQADSKGGGRAELGMFCVS